MEARQVNILKAALELPFEIEVEKDVLLALQRNSMVVLDKEEHGNVN